MRQFVLAVVGILMVSALAACGGGTSSPSAQDKWCDFASTVSGKDLVQDTLILPDPRLTIRMAEGLHRVALSAADHDARIAPAATAARQMEQGIREMRSTDPLAVTPMAEAGAFAYDEQVLDVCGGGQR